MEIEFWKSTFLMLFMLNPFFMSIYLLPLFDKLSKREFRSVMLRGSLVSMFVFLLFSFFGDRVFTDVLQARFSSFLIFGGLIFLLIGIRFVFQGVEALEMWRGHPEHVAGSVAMPFLIGPGTITASVYAGGNLDFHLAVLSIVSSVSVAIATVVLLKVIYDHVKERNEPLVSRYIVITGRVMALVVGTYAIEMIAQGIELWYKNWHAG